MSVDQSVAYAYNSISKVYLGQIDLLPDPLDKGKYQLWKNCTLKKPLEVRKGYAIVFNEKSDNWEYIEDHTGEKGFLNDQPYEITEFGPLPEGFSYSQSDIVLTNNRINELRNICLFILSSTDYLLFPDYELDENDKELIINFRKKIRNLDKEEGYPWIDKQITDIIPEWPLKNKKCPYNVRNS